jgi:hypothetical protein
MKSSNPHSGVYVADTSRTLDLNGGNPACNQGGTAVVEPVAIDGYNQTISNTALSIRASKSDVDHVGAVIQPVPGFLLDDQGGQQIGVRTDDVAPTLRAEAHGNVPAVVCAAGFKELNSAKARSDAYEHENAPTLSATKHDACVCVKTYESHPMDSRIKEIEDDISPTVSVKWHKGAADTPLVCEAKTWDARGNGEGDVVSTLTGDHENRITDYTSILCMATQQGGAEIAENLCPTITAAAGMSGNNQPVIAMQNPRYIVRRLTPTECARLQGFPDKWGHPDRKDTFTDDEYRFWLDVRNTHAAINGKAVKEYTREQMLNWYNKLHTDSAEYKMWGNGIALPPALYCMRGIAEELHG